jgi:thiamine-phosphate pyrophosphorylase
MAVVKPACRLYLTLPATGSAALEASFAHAIAGADVACTLLYHNDAPIDETSAGRMLGLAHEREIAFLIENDAELAIRLGADGVHIGADASAYTRARSRLGKSAIIGVDCGVSRHDAMVFAEMGADYVAFGSMAESWTGAQDQRAELIAWWSEIFQAPCVAFDVKSTEEAERLASLGADFVALAETIWQADDAADRVADIDRAISHGRRAA